MRALVVACLLLLPGLVQAAGPAPLGEDLIVRLAPGATLPLPEDALPLHVVPGFVLLQAPPGAAEAWRHAPGVLRVERAVPLERHQADAAPVATDPNHRLTRADEARTIPGGPTGRGITVAVVDSGIDTTHPDLAGRVKANLRLVQGRFLDAPGDLDGHGTHVAGVIAADGGTSGGRARGIAPAASLVGIDISERFNTASALLAYDWLFVNREAHGIRIVVNAWGRVDEGARFDPDDSVVRAIDRLVDEGVVVLFSASNHGPGPSTLSLEAQNPRVLTVGATDAAAQLMPYSSRGPVRPLRGEPTWIKPDVLAPGEQVLSLRSLQSPPHETDPDPFHRVLSGTSQSVPHVAGIVALMLETNASLRPHHVINIFRETGIDLGAKGPDDDAGFGLADAVDALRRAQGQPPDRGNVLVSGGTDTYTDATLAPATGGNVLGFLTRTEEVWRTRVPVKPGATQLRFDLAATAPANALTVTLHSGDDTYGPWTLPSGDTVLRGRLDQPPPGVYELIVQGALPVATQLEATTQVDVLGDPTRAAPLDPRYLLPEDSRELTGDFSRDAQILVTQGRLFFQAHPGFVPTLLAGFLMALALRAPVRPRHVRREIVLEDLD